ncbi:MASE1 domain-containing protein [Actinopolymorpha sp. B11F2]|uniref:MASE1 domain-containing protein n=1 Tax=Actinopolymorpha sp. B11F2 TaxID=3160862 RepID=UPI0032E46E9E
MLGVGRATSGNKSPALLGMQVFGVAAAYYAGTYLGVLTTPLGLPVTSLWVSAGVALACLLLFGVKVWPGIFVGSFLSNMTAVPALEAVLVASGNTIAPVCAYLLLRRVGFRIELDRIKDAVSFVLLGAFAAMSLSASIGTAALVAADSWPARDFLHLWFAWWSSDVLGVLVVTPLLLLLREFRLVRHVGWSRRIEFVALLLATLTLTIVANFTFGLVFLGFPLIVFAALRFQLSGVAPCASLVAAVTIESAGRGYRPFEGRGLLESVFILQVFNGALVLTGLLLAVVITQWHRARVDVQLTCFQLADAVGRLQRSMLPDLEKHGDAGKVPSRTVGEEGSPRRLRDSGRKWREAS